ncbi:MAG: hypothetical protein CV088_15525 [Nitrospira sp. LK70]|nr:hypothetical protein [Nitrospira sp. LK70]
MSAALHEPFGGIHIVHSMPGRVRFRVPMLKTSPNLARGLEAVLSARPGIIKTSVTERCQSLTVSFEPETWTAESLYQVLNDQMCGEIEVWAASAPAIDSPGSFSTTWLQPWRFLQSAEGTDQAREPVKSVYWTLGYYSMIIGAILVPVPLLPGIPFLIFSSYCFGKATIWKEKQEAEEGEPLDKVTRQIN